MKNKLPALWLGTAMMTAVPFTIQAQSPATISFPQGGQFRLSISNTDPNLIFIPGDKVTAITAQGGMLADKKLTSAGRTVVYAGLCPSFVTYLSAGQSALTSASVFSVLTKEYLCVFSNMAP